MKINDIIVKPIITEKTLGATQNNKYCFEVAAGATKYQIKQAIESAFKVNVIKIQTSILKGKSKRTGKKRLVQDAAPLKKAYVALRAGQSISVFETKGQS